MNNVIVYATKTKHSQKIADALHKRMGWPVFNVKEQPVLKEVNNLIIIGGVYGGSSLVELVNFVYNLHQKEVKQVILITSGASQDPSQKDILSILKEKRIKVVGEHCVPGGFLFYKRTHPNQQDIESCIEYIIDKTAEKIL